MAFKFVSWMILVLLLVFPDRALLTDDSVGTEHKVVPWPPKDCYDIYQSNTETPSGVYTVQPMDNGTLFQVYCDMETDNGGWTVFQRRRDGSLDFYRDWADYKTGFGFPAAEFWLGNDRLYRLTNQRTYELRIDMEDFEDETRFAKYDKFVIGDDFSQYKLILGQYSGDAGDSLGYHNNRVFTTRDKDNDIYAPNNCGILYGGGWWYGECHESNLNGWYLGETEAYAKGIVWSKWKEYYYSLKNTEMKIRPAL